MLEGYGDAFITAYKDGKRIPMSATKATMETTEKKISLKWRHLVQ